MNRYRQNIQRQNSKALKKIVLEQYGMTPRELKTDRKEPISKSKAKKQIMIAKNKKLPQSFTAYRVNQQEIKSPKNRQSKSNKKQGEFFHIWQQNSTYTREQQDSLNGMKTSKFGFDSINDKENNRLKSSRQIQIKPQTYFSDIVEAFELRQRLKKSTSMKNLIEQRFMYGSENEKKQQTQIENRQNKEGVKPYDSTKYNWRLSKSKQKLQKQKSLSALSCKAKLLCDLQKKQPNGNKLTLDNLVEPKQNKPKLKSQQILSFEYNPQNLSYRTQGKCANHPQSLSYTFGSDVMNSLQFG